VIKEIVRQSRSQINVSLLPWIDVRKSDLSKSKILSVLWCFYMVIMSKAPFSIPHFFN